MVARVFISNGDKVGESKEAERPRERECVSASIGGRQQ